MLKKTINYITLGFKSYFKGLPIKSIVALSLLAGLFMALWASVAFAGSKGFFSTPAFGGDIIRLHVIANSDDPKDQEIKLKVRDAVLKYATPYLSDLENGKSAKSIIQNHLNGIEQAASQELATLGVIQSVHVELGYSDFPVKTYDNVTLPAGKYRAVRVIIGEGKGKNWWCVMFPPLCMVDASHTASKDKAVKIIQQNMSDYDVLNGGQKRPTFRISFKIFELFKGNQEQKNYN